MEYYINLHFADDNEFDYYVKVIPKNATANEIYDDIEDSISSYIESIGYNNPKQLIEDVLKQCTLISEYEIINFRTIII